MMAPDPAPLDPDAYADWINARVGAVCCARLKRKGKTAYILAIPGKLSDQTIVNIKGGRHSIGLKNLARLARQLGTTVPSIIIAAHRRK